ncbi:hypothetical protein ACLMJK_003323 [Lecanora helva]
MRMGRRSSSHSGQDLEHEDEENMHSFGPGNSTEDYELNDFSGHEIRRKKPSRGFDAYDEADHEVSHQSLGSRRVSVSTVQSFMLYTPDEEKNVIRKFDRRLVLFVASLYMLSFLDRSNIGNARIAGLSDDLHLSSYQYEWLLRIFYISYILFEWMTLLWKIFPPHIYLALCVASWGLIASVQSLAFSYASLLLLRAALGIAEAAFVGVPFFMSFFYKRDELAFRTGLFISAAPLATSFASSLAWVITKIGSHVPIASWRLLFLIEGFPSIIVAVLVYFHIPDNPESAKYLSRRQQQVAKLRLRNGSEGLRDRKSDGLDWKEIGSTFIDPQSYLTAAMFFCANVAFSSMPVFLPTIIEEMGHSAAASQALSAPPYLVAFFTVLATAHLSDHYRTRSAFVVFHSLLAATGYAGMAITGSLKASPQWRYVGVYPAAMGFFSVVTILITWTINNQESDSKKGTGLAILNYVGQLGPLVGVHLYPDRDQPYYVFGMTTCACFMATVAVVALGLRKLLSARNRRARAEQPNDDGEDEGLVASDRRDRLVHFEFML